MPTYNTYKNGIVAAYHAVNKVCHIMARYGPKLIAWIDHELAVGNINQAQHDQVEAFLNGINALCAVFAILANIE